MCCASLVGFLFAPPPDRTGITFDPQVEATFSGSPIPTLKINPTYYLDESGEWLDQPGIGPHERPTKLKMLVLASHELTHYEHSCHDERFNHRMEKVLETTLNYAMNSTGTLLRVPSNIGMRRPSPEADAENILEFDF